MRLLELLEPVQPAVVGLVVDVGRVGAVVCVARRFDARDEVFRLGTRIVEGEVRCGVGHETSLGLGP